MKARTASFGLLILSLFICHHLQAQRANYTFNRGISLGLGGGKAYQTSDIAYSSGFGFDFSLGSSLYYKENAFLSLDWKFRFLAGENKSYDLSINTDNSISNLCYRFYGYDLELGLTLNRLRERTRIVLTGFAGMGITHGLTFTDLYDAGNNAYDYGNIDLNRDPKVIYRDLLALSDGDYETTLINRAALLPTAGLFLGYQITRSITAGFTFKTNIYLTETNSFLGLDLDNRVFEGSALDRNNYISAGLRWTLRLPSSRSEKVPRHPQAEFLPGSQVKEAEELPISVAHPSVYITDPGSDSYHTASTTHTLWAIVNHVEGSDQIGFYQNGFPNHNFSYNEGTNIFIANVDLREGENRFRIQATNQASSAEDLVTIVRQNPSESPTDPAKEEIGVPGSSEEQPLFQPGQPDYLPFPGIRFIRPASPVQVENKFFPLSASIQHVPGRKHISLTLNGVRISNFSYHVNGHLTVTLLLKEGSNTIELTAENEAGMAYESTSISYVKPLYHLPVYSAPVIHEPVRNEPVIHEPTRNEAVVPEPAVRERIAREPVSRRPGNRIPVVTEPLTSDPVISEPVPSEPVLSEAQSRERATQKPVTRVPVGTKPGSGTPVSTEPVTRDVASREGATRKPVTQVPVTTSAPPVISIVDPVTHPYKTSKSSEVLRAIILNVTSKENIKLTINGANTRNFNFSKNTKELSVRFNLKEGKNTMVIEAENKSGSQVKDQSFIKETVPCTHPQIEYTVNEVKGKDATHVLKGSVSGINNKADISFTVDGKTHDSYQFIPATGDLNASLNLSAGTHTLRLEASNDCGSDSKTKTLQVEKESGAVRINPGNSDWQFCMVTPTGTFSRDQLTNSSFSYSGTASSLYFKPIGGGGDVLVNGRPYPLKSGQYYLFTGNLKVSISNKHPDSMGHWSVSLHADRAPLTGNGNSRPESPCETEKKNADKGPKNRR